MKTVENIHELFAGYKVIPAGVAYRVLMSSPFIQTVVVKFDENKLDVLHEKLTKLIEEYKDYQILMEEYPDISDSWIGFRFFCQFIAIDKKMLDYDFTNYKSGNGDKLVSYTLNRVERDKLLEEKIKDYVTI